MMQMSHPWMYGDRRTTAYREGVHSFRDAAEANKHGGGFMFCPCVECRNEKDHAPSMSSKQRSPPNQKLSPLPKVPYPNLPITPYDRTTEENARIAKEHYDTQMKKEEPEPRPEYTEKQKDYAKYLLTLPLQYDLHHKPDDYLRTLQKEGKKSRSSTSVSGSKSSKKCKQEKIRRSLARTTG
jgi:hypothetical protein